MAAELDTEQGHTARLLRWGFPACVRYLAHATTVQVPMQLKAPATQSYQAESVRDENSQPVAKWYGAELPRVLLARREPPSFGHPGKVARCSARSSHPLPPTLDRSHRLPPSLTLLAHVHPPPHSGTARAGRTICNCGSPPQPTWT